MIVTEGVYCSYFEVVPNPFIFNLLALKVDCDVATVSLNDALNSRVDFSKLGEPFNVLGVGGTVPTYTIIYCILGYDLGNCVISERMSQIYISNPVVTKENADAIKRTPH